MIMHMMSDISIGNTILEMMGTSLKDAPVFVSLAIDKAKIWSFNLSGNTKKSTVTKTENTKAVTGGIHDLILPLSFAI